MNTLESILSPAFGLPREVCALIGKARRDLFYRERVLPTEVLLDRILFDHVLAIEAADSAESITIIGQDFDTTIEAYIHWSMIDADGDYCYNDPYDTDDDIRDICFCPSCCPRRAQDSGVATSDSD